ncbi:hypothetical protein DID75_04730 [Candidatus Marinamargulisbacteria bacterium SCGC AG-410-N11]|nr:hypothetical protein DID75_04730 [Candidatus Marinamargulisbacteria bacterium SCGC AG-410-N11]
MNVLKDSMLKSFFTQFRSQKTVLNEQHLFKDLLSLQLAIINAETVPQNLERQIDDIFTRDLTCFSDFVSPDQLLCQLAKTLLDLLHDRPLPKKNMKKIIHELELNELVVTIILKRIESPSKRLQKKLDKTEKRCQWLTQQITSGMITKSVRELKRESKKL